MDSALLLCNFATYQDDWVLKEPLAVRCNIFLFFLEVDTCKKTKKGGTCHEKKLDASMFPPIDLNSWKKESTNFSNIKTTTSDD